MRGSDVREIVGMEQPPTTSYPVSDFRQWNESGQLELAPKFQRRSVWEPKAKSYLIDTIVRSMPVPPVFIRLRLDTRTNRSVREVVDGQQRLRTVLDFLGDDFPISRVHNRELAGKRYSALPEPLKRKILRYKFAVTTLEDVTDAEVLAIFARLNTYTVRLNAQELRNAEFFGAFKQTIYSLALDHYAFWRNTAILSDQQVARMDEAELVSELVVTMLAGIRQTRAADLRDFYSRFDDTFPEADRVTREFATVIDLAGELLADGFVPGFFTRRPVFYSLFVALYDARFGLPKSSRGPISLKASDMNRVRARLERVQGRLAEDEPPASYAKFRDDSRYATADVGRRRARHEFLWRRVLSEPSS
jgi:Protein of unknown function DUF262